MGTNLIIAIGLCVDYSAHIAHSFMMNTGTRDVRVKEALRKIGPAVLNGGFSTFLAFVLLGGSRSHVFLSFFKIFFLVVVFGLYNGLVFLPVMLSLCGPRSYNHDDAPASTVEETEPLKPIIKSTTIELTDNHKPSVPSTVQNGVNHDSKHNTLFDSGGPKQKESSQN